MKKIIDSCYTFYIPIIMALAIIWMFGYDTNKYLEYPLVLVLGFKGGMLLLKRTTHQTVKIFSCFLLYCLISGVLYTFNGVPFHCYILSIQLFLIPMFFFYFGYRYKSWDDSFEKMFIYGCAFCFLVGFYLYIARPSYYLLAMERANSNINDADLVGRDLADFLRYGSFFFNSYQIEFFSVPALVLSLYYVNRKYINNILLYTAAIASFIAAIICIQRASTAGAIGVLLFFILYKGKGGKLKTTLVLSTLVVLAITLFITNEISSTDSYDSLSFQFNDMLSRFDFSEAMDERKHQYAEFTRSTFFSNIFGLGMGTCGHQARYYGLQTINDNQYMLLFHEFGIIGCLLLAAVVINSTIRGIKHFKIYYPQLLIIGYFLFAFIGAEPLEVAYVSSILWFSLGRIWNKDYYNRRLLENTSK